MKEKTLWVTLGILGGVFGVALAVYLWMEKIEERKLLQAVEREQHIYRLYHHGDYKDAKDALLSHVKLLDRSNAENEKPNQNIYAADAVINYVRLAKLEQKYGGPEAKAFMQEACARCKQMNEVRLNWKDCSEADLRATVDKVDTVPAR